MTSDGISQLLTLYLWFPLAAFLFFLLLIARLYEKFSEERTHFRLFVLPIILFGIHAVYQTNNNTGSDLVMSLVPAVGGILLIILCARLYRKMMSLT